MRTNTPVSGEQQRKFPRKEMLRIYELDGFEGAPHQYAAKLSREILGEMKQQLGVTGIYDADGQNYEKLWKANKGLRVATAEAGQQLSEAINANILRKKQWKTSLGVFGIIAGLSAINADNSVARELSHTSLGRFANSRGANRTAAILDITAASWDTAQVSSARVRVAGAKPPIAMGMAGIQVIAGALTAIIAGGKMFEAIENDDTVSALSYGAMTITSGAAAVTAGTALGVTMLGGTEIGLFIALASAAPIAGVIAAVVVLLAAIVLALWGESTLLTLVKKGFWGRTKGYSYWNMERRYEDISLQIDKAKILANKTAQEEAVAVAQAEKELLAKKKALGTELERLRNSTSLRMGYQQHKKATQLEREVKNLENDFTKKYGGSNGKLYLEVRRGFIEELYDWGILGGMHIEAMGNREFRLSFTGFSKTKPTAENLSFTYQVYGKSKKISFKPEMLVTEQEPNEQEQKAYDVYFIFSRVSQVSHESYRINVTFSDSDDDRFATNYATPQFNQDQKDRQEAQLERLNNSGFVTSGML